MEKKHVQFEVFRPNGSSFFIPVEENELSQLNGLADVLDIIRECPNTDADIRKTPCCWLELCGHNHDLPSYGRTQLRLSRDVFRVDHFMLCSHRSRKCIGVY